MFSGLVEAKSPLAAMEWEEGGVRIHVVRPAEFTDLKIGDSIAVQGCCLTIVQVDQRDMVFQAGQETLSRTTLGAMAVGRSVNLERSLRMGDRLGGHLVTGHIDGLGRVVERRNLAEWSDIVFEAPGELMVQMASKGSVAVDGVSLTLVDVDSHTFSVALIPHTLAETTLGELKPGDAVNLETDLLAKYVQRQLQSSQLNGKHHV
jgi:riboflavin synthase